MKKYVLFFLFAMLTLSAIDVHAGGFKRDTQNEFTTAESIDEGMTQMGVFFTLGDDFRSFYPAFRYGLGALFEVGVKLGVVTVDTGTEDKLGGLVGADLKYQLIKATEGVPVDMALDLGFDNTFISRKNLSELTFSTIFSKGFPLTDRGYKLTPYGGLEVSSLYGSYPEKNDTNFYVFAGIEWKLSQKFMIVTEVKIGDITVGGAGIRFEY